MQIEKLIKKAPGEGTPGPAQSVDKLTRKQPVSQAIRTGGKRVGSTKKPVKI